TRLRVREWGEPIQTTREKALNSVAYVLSHTHNLKTTSSFQKLIHIEPDKDTAFIFIFVLAPRVKAHGCMLTAQQMVACILCILLLLSNHKL
ncbi:MAG: hypothetical protein ACK56I_21690, partial [bacterium]